MRDRVGEDIDDDHSGNNQDQPDDGSQVEVLFENEKADKRDKNDTHSRPNGVSYAYRNALQYDTQAIESRRVPQNGQYGRNEFGKLFALFQERSDIRLRWQPAMDYYRRELYFEVEYHKYLQFKFDQQWRRLKAYANSKGIRIIGDIPIYVALDSADAWANPGLFQLDKDNIPTAVAGVPPDGFSPTGQLWGNPLYRWEAHRATGYQWWITRLWYCFELYDVVRIDHFRGFDEYFSIPYGSETAAPGHWEKGPGIELFRAVEQALGKREIIAEDLGYMSDTVRQLVRDSGFPGMKVLEFAFDSRDTGSASDYLPHNYPVNSVAYTGTHDNETLVSWYQTITGAERAMVRDYLFDYATPEEQLYKSMIALILRSAAATCIIPMQDWLGLDNSARINQPSTVGQNWRWRLKKPQLTKKLQKEICQLTTRYGRKNWA